MSAPILGANSGIFFFVVGADPATGCLQEENSSCLDMLVPILKSACGDGLAALTRTGEFAKLQGA